MTQKLLQAAVEVSRVARDGADSNPLAIAKVAPTTSENEHTAVSHLELARTVERINRRFADLLRIEMGKLGVVDIGPAQVMVLLTIGGDELSVRDLLDKGHYLGSNVSYYLKQLVDLGYIDRAASQRDRRSARISLTERGRAVCDALRVSDKSYHRMLVRDEDEAREFETAYRVLQRLELVWTNAARYGTT